MRLQKGTKILFVITKSNWGGAQAYVYTLATHLAREGMNVSVALGGTGNPGASSGLLAKRLADAGVRTIDIKSFMRDISLVREWLALFELWRVIRTERPQVLHLNSSKAGGIGALAGRAARVPRILFTSHGLAYDEERALPARALIRLATWATFCLAHCVIVMSSDNERRARRLPLCGRKITLIYNGIAPIAYKPREAAREALALPAKNMWVGTIAEFTKNKALPSLIEAAALLVERGYSFVLGIIGEDGEERKALEALIQARGLGQVVRLIGFVPDAATFLKAFDIFTLVSVKEGLPTVLLEAGAAGCAVVGSRIPGITDIVEDGVSGLLVEPKQSAKIADALARLLDEDGERERLGAMLIKRVAQTFSRDTMLRKTLACYTPSYS